MASRKVFTAEYRAQAAALVVETDRSIADVARSLGIHPNTLGNWVKAVKERGDMPEKALSVDERAELEKLRKDYAQLVMDNAFLKKAAAWFASQNK